MAISEIQNLITDLHTSFTAEDEEPSPQQQQLLAQMQAYSHGTDEAEPELPKLSESAELLLEEVQESYPKSAAIIREVINILANMGI
mgnify:CR=1 FL=1